ncbi:MAG: aldose 1-epimerase family protein [Clostridia bacterium]|nr:aldose 1-epimerase family protein [Clostridia bacterium]
MLTTLKNEKLTVVVSSVGAEPQSIVSADGLNYLWDGHAPYWNRRSPVLFPIIGALRNNAATSAHGDIRLPKHGFCRSAPFETVSESETSVTHRYTDNEETFAKYPYHFEFSVTHNLKDDVLETIYTVKNTGDYDMPFCVGGHPAFNVPLVEGEAYTDYAVEFSENETTDCPLIDMNTCLIADATYNRLLTDEKSFRLNHVLFRGDALVFETLKSKSVKLVSQKSGRGVEMDISGFPVFAVWTMVDDQPFVCFEPWQGGATRDSEDDVFEHKNHCVIAAPGEVKEFRFTVRMF